ncbi:MAG: NrsF family protein [Siculibacillus sp.]|nr:NrsF family protein [Siculibacillus sp.]
MRTDDLIGGLVADVEMRTPPLGRGLLAAGVVGMALSGTLFFAALGPRPDVAAALATPRFVLKFVECAALAAAAAAAALALMRPAADRRLARLCLLLVAFGVTLGVMVEVVVVPRADWPARLLGTNWLHCLVLVPLLALPAFVTLLAAARHGAATEPGRTGAMIGVLAGAIGAFFYAANCTDDSPLFVATWYTLAIGAMALLGALLGRRLLVW